jgi:hypothetical protein
MAGAISGIVPLRYAPTAGRAVRPYGFAPAGKIAPPSKARNSSQRQFLKKVLFTTGQFFEYSRRCRLAQTKLANERESLELFAAAGCQFQFDAATSKPLIQLANSQLKKL